MSVHTGVGASTATQADRRGTPSTARSTGGARQRYINRLQLFVLLWLATFAVPSTSDTVAARASAPRATFAADREDGGGAATGAGTSDTVQTWPPHPRLRLDAAGLARIRAATSSSATGDPRARGLLGNLSARVDYILAQPLPSAAALLSSLQEDIYPLGLPCPGLL